MGHRLLSDGTTKVRAKLPGLEAGEAATGLRVLAPPGREGSALFSHSFYFRLLSQSRRRRPAILHKVKLNLPKKLNQYGSELSLALAVSPSSLQEPRRASRFLLSIVLTL